MISSVEQDAIFSGSGKDRKQIGVTTKVKLWDKVQALTILARHFKLLEPEEPTKRPLQIIITDAPAQGGPRVVNGSDGTDNSNSAGRKVVA